MATKQEVGEALGATMPLFANYRPPASAKEMQVLVNAWHGLVGHLDAATLQAALQLTATRSEFFPTPALVLAAVTELTVAPARTGADAWGDVVAAIKEHGVYHPPGGVQVLAVAGEVWDFDDPLVSKLVKAFGWRDLCMSENAVADRARFIPAYEAEQRREREQARLTPGLLAFQEQKRAELPAPTALQGADAHRAQAAARVVAERSKVG